MPISFPSVIDPELYAQTFDDFLYQASATTSDVTLWTNINDGATGTPAYQSAVNGWFNVVTAAASDDYSTYRSVSKNFQFLSGKRVWLDASFKLSEATTNESAWWFGFNDTTTTGGFGTGTNGPLSSFDGALVYKKSGAMNVSATASHTTTQSTIANFGTAITNTAHRVQLYFDGTNVTAHFYNGTSWSTSGQILVPTLASQVIGYVMWGVKAGASGGAETLQVDYIRVVNDR